MFRILISCVTTLSFLFLCWYAGADMLERTPEHAVGLFLSIAQGLFVYFCPAWEL